MTSTEERCRFPKPFSSSILRISSQQHVSINFAGELAATAIEIVQAKEVELANGGGCILHFVQSAGNTHPKIGDFSGTTFVVVVIS